MALEERQLLSTFTVTSTLDDGSDGTLRWAVAQANLGGDNTIAFDSTVFGTPQTITLSGTQLELSDTTGTETITGPAAGVTVSGGGLSRVFQVDELVTASISGMTVTGGRTEEYGFSRYGGGLQNLGTLTLTGCTVTGNVANGRGGGLYNLGSVTLTDCDVTGNTSSFTGGGGVAGGYGTLTLSGCTLSGNSGGGLYSFGSATLTDCTISGNSGTGLDNLFGTLTLTNCTVSGNSGGVYSRYGTTTLTDSTVSGNTAPNGVGGLTSTGTVTLTNTIIAGNQSPSGDVAGSFSGTNNLIGTGNSGLVNGVDGNIVGVASPLLGPLANYGGTTQTMALLPGSPAIDAGGSGPSIPATDQRGLGRVGGVDIGAFESQGFRFAIVPGSTPQASDIGTAFASPLAVTAAANNPAEPVDGGVVTFVANPAANGATAIFLDPTAIIAGGQAALTAAPSNVLGTYTVAASAGGSLSFELTNTGQAFAALVVNDTSNALAPGAGLLSLWEAVAFASTNPPSGSSISFDATVFAAPRVITLTGRQLELSNTGGAQSITGPAAGVTISGGGLSRVFQVDSSVTASLSGLTITGGSTAESGGGVYNAGALTLIGCTVGGNSAVKNGGGVATVGGSLSLTDSTVSGNSAGYGGGLATISGAATLTGCTVSGNTAHRGGGLGAREGILVLTGCTVSGNTASYTGGLYDDQGSLTLTGCTVSGNFANSSGGGLRMYHGILTLTDCTVSGNTARFSIGGVASYYGSGTLTNCTISDNTASAYGRGGGVMNLLGALTLTNCTVSGNFAGLGGGGVYNFATTYSTGTVTIANTIVAANGSSDVFGAFASQGNNLIGKTDGSTGWIGSDLTGTVVFPLSPVLSPLGDYGGPTQTVALLPGSPAIGAGRSGPGIPATDQRGLGRVGGVDIGAFESQGFRFAIVPGSTPQASDIGTAFASPLAVTAAANNPVEPVDGGVVTFLPEPSASGASAIFLDPSAVIAGGRASLIAAPNNVLGSYTVATSLGGSLSFELTNTGQAFAALVVNDTSDALTPGPGLLSLREAVAFANAGPAGGSSIGFDAAVFAAPRVITLAGRQLELSHTGGVQSITGPAAGVTVSGGGLSRVLRVDPLVTASISGLTITGGSTAEGGGGVLVVGGTATLIGVTITGNSALNGGALYSTGGVTTLASCTVSGNSAGNNGGGVYAIGGTSTITASTISGNTAVRNGGGVYDRDGTTTLTDSTFSANSARQAGGVYSLRGTTTLTGCTVSGNNAGNIGGVANSAGTVTLSGCTVSANSSTTGSSGGLSNFRGTATLTDCTISGNTSRSSGGGLSNGGIGATMSLSNCIVSGNTARTRGGGLDNSGMLTMTGCTVISNSVRGGFGFFSGIGGGVNNNNATLIMTGCTVSGNSAARVGGGVYNVSSRATLTSCTVSGNTTGGSGGGLYDRWSSVTLTDCTVTGNTARFNSGGLQNFTFGRYIGTATLTGCTISGNSAGSNGGGLLDAGVTATLTDCTISGNSASSGGGLLNDRGSPTTLVNCTVSGNSARTSGGGLDNVSGTVTFGNSIVAVNTAGTSGPDAFGAVVSQGNNLVGKTDSSSGWVGSDLTGTIASPLDPLLATLGNYGGPTLTMPLLPGSPAIDAGSNALIPAGVTTDQRGFARIVNTVVDIGAFESGGFTIAVTSGSVQSTGVLTAFAAPLVVTVTANNPGEPVAGGLVTFTPPTSGASASLSGSPATIGAGGTASVSASANGIVGGYAVMATARGIATPASFGLTNVPLILALDPSAAGALSLSGNAVIDTPGIVYVDSGSSGALSAGDNALIMAAAIDVHGGVQSSGNASLSPAPVTRAPALIAAKLPSPDTQGMPSYGSFSLGGNSAATIEPGIYTQIVVSGNAKLTLASGVYIIEGGGLSVSGNAGITGSGVMIVSAGSNYPASGGTYGSLTLGGNATMNLSPAASGPYAGIVLFQPPDNTKAITVGGNASGITGTIYAPGAKLTVGGNAKLVASLIVDTLAISGNGISDGPAGPSGTMADGPATVTATAAAFNQSIAIAITIPVKLEIRVTNALGNSVGASSLPVVSRSAVVSSGTRVPQPAPGDSRADGLFTSDATSGSYPFNRGADQRRRKPSSGANRRAVSWSGS